MCSSDLLSNEELRTLVEAPREANLTEWVLAKKLLASRGPEETPARSRQEINDWALDPHAAFDARLGRWLGLLVLCSFSVCIIILIRVMIQEFGTGDHDPATHSASWNPGAHTRRLPRPDEFGAPLRELIPMLLPSASSLALIFSWRIMRNGQRRWMFPKVWRDVGWWSLMLSLGSIAAGVALFIYRHSSW